MRGQRSERRHGCLHRLARSVVLHRFLVGHQGEEPEVAAALVTSKRSGARFGWPSSCRFRASSSRRTTAKMRKPSLAGLASDVAFPPPPGGVVSRGASVIQRLPPGPRSPHPLHRRVFRRLWRVLTSTEGKSDRGEKPRGVSRPNGCLGTNASPRGPKRTERVAGAGVNLVRYATCRSPRDLRVA
jgi:hypothetical protein